MAKELRIRFDDDDGKIYLGEVKVKKNGKESKNFVHDYKIDITEMALDATVNYMAGKLASDEESPFVELPVRADDGTKGILTFRIRTEMDKGNGMYQ